MTRSTTWWTRPSSSDPLIRHMRNNRVASRLACFVVLILASFTSERRASTPHPARHLLPKGEGKNLETPALSSGERVGRRRRPGEGFLAANVAEKLDPRSQLPNPQGFEFVRTAATPLIAWRFPPPGAAGLPPSESCRSPSR